MNARSRWTPCHVECRSSSYPHQPALRAGIEIFLEEPGPPAQDEATAAQLRELITKLKLTSLKVLDQDEALDFYVLVRRWRRTPDPDSTQSGLAQTSFPLPIGCSSAGSINGAARRRQMAA